MSKEAKRLRDECIQYLLLSFVVSGGMMIVSTLAVFFLVVVLSRVVLVFRCVGWSALSLSSVLLLLVVCRDGNAAFASSPFLVPFVQ